MTCCVIALALAYQLVAGWRALKRLLGIAPRPDRAPRATGVLVATLVQRVRRPAWRVALLAVLALEAGAASGYAYNHRHHIGNEVAVVLFGITGFARDLCRGGTAREPSGTALSDVVKP